AARVPFTKINLTAASDGAVSVKLKIQRTGISEDNDFSSISFLEGIKQLGNTKTLNSNHQCLSDSIVVSAGTTRAITVAGNMHATNGSAGSASLEVVEVQTDGAAVSGSLPAAGNAMALSNAITIGTATLARGSYDPNSTATKEIGTTNYTFTSFKITASTEAQQVEYIKFTNQGSIADADLENVRLYVNNTEYTTGTLSSKLVEFDLSSNPVSIAKGGNKEFSVVADIVGGSGRTIDFDIYKTTDVAVKGTDFGYYITPSAALDAGNTVTVSAGSLTISKSNKVVTGNITEGSTSVALGSWNFKVQGEVAEITQSQFIVTVTGTGDYADVTNCTLYDANNNAVTGAVDPVVTTFYVTYTDTISAPVGDNVYTMKCNLNTDFANGDTIVVSADTSAAASFAVKGATTGDAITEQPTADVAANTQTIKAGSLASYTAATPVAQSLVKGSLQAHFANITLDASGSGEDVKVTQMVITDTPAVNGKTQNVANIKLYVNGVAKSIVKNGSTATVDTAENFTFSLSGNDTIIVPKGQTVTVQVKADISASAVTSATHTFDLNSIVCQGNSTGETITSTPSGAGQAMPIVAAGTLTTSIDSANPEAALMAAGSTGNTLTVLKMEALYEDIELDTIVLTSDVTTAASSTANDVAMLYLYDEDGNKVLAVTATSTTYQVTVPDYTEDANGNWLSGFKVTNEDTDGTKLYIKADLNSIGTGLPGTSGAQIGYKVNVATDIVATGAESGQGATEAGTANSNTHWIYGSVPTVAIQSLPTTTLANGTATLYKFTVAASAQGDIDLAKVAFTMATTSCTITGMKVYDTTGSTEVELNATGVTSDGSNVVTVAFDEAKIRTITKGTSKTFALKGTVADAATAGDSVITQLNGDAAAIATQMYPTTYALAAADTNGEFIWSDRSASSHAVGTADWVNGYLVSGLNATVSSGAVLSK
ncbi:hypothetical protein KJ695_05420, partial [Patescibacteria group bacterium]|nr:hypothetical protein [Patescibacteria group bacterium]